MVPACLYHGPGSRLPGSCRRPPWFSGESTFLPAFLFDSTFESRVCVAGRALVFRRDAVSLCFLAGILDATSPYQLCILGACPSNGSDCVTGAVSPDTRHLRRRRCSGIVEEQEQSRWTHATCNPSGAWGLRPISLSFVVADAVVSCPINTMPFVAGETVSDSRRDDESMLGIGEEEQQRSRAVAPATRRAEATLADLLVARRRRCHCIASFSLRDLDSKSPPQMTWYLWDRTLASTPPLFVTSTRKPHARNRDPLLGQAPRSSAPPVIYDQSLTVL